MADIQKFIYAAGSWELSQSIDFENISGPIPHTLMNDLMFRIVFEVNPDALRSLLCALLHLKPEDIVSMEITNPIRLGEHIDEKDYVFDIYLRLNNAEKIHLELQVLSQNFWPERSLCYLCRSFDSLNPGENYDQVKPAIQIDILDFDLYPGCEEFYACYHLANDKNHRIYSSKIALYVLDLNKGEFATEEDKAYHIDYWAQLFHARTWEEVRNLIEECNCLKSTAETMYRVNADGYARTELLAREDAIRRQRTIQQKHERELQERDNRLAEQEAELNAKDEQLAAKDKLISQYEAFMKAHGITME